MESGYPVLESRELAPCPRSHFRRHSRSLEDLPTQHPGSVLVFQTGESFALAPSDRRLDLRSSLVVNAEGVSCVSLRRTLVDCHIEIPSATTGERFTITTRFECMVTDPAVALQEGYWDLTPFLGAYVATCPKLKLCGHERRRENLAELEANVIARMTKYNETKPPHFSGLQVSFVEVSASTSTTPVPPSDTNLRSDRAGRTQSQISVGAHFHGDEGES